MWTIGIDGTSLGHPQSGTQGAKKSIAGDRGSNCHDSCQCVAAAQCGCLGYVPRTEKLRIKLDSNSGVVDMQWIGQGPGVDRLGGGVLSQSHTEGFSESIYRKILR